MFSFFLNYSNYQFSETIIKRVWPRMAGKGMNWNRLEKRRLKKKKGEKKMLSSFYHVSWKNPQQKLIFFLYSPFEKIIRILSLDVMGAFRVREKNI